MSGASLASRWNIRIRAAARRIRLMMRHTWLVGIAGSLLLVVAAGSAYYFYSRPTTLTIAVGPPNSEDLRIVQAIAQQLARDRASIRLHVLVKDGPIESSAAIDSREADLAVVRRDLGMPKDGQAVAIFRKNVVVLLVPAPTSTGLAKTKAKAKTIEKIDDLAGRRIGVIGRNPANISLLNIILKQYDIAPDKVTVVQFGTSDVAPSIRESKADAILLVGPIGSKITADAIAASSRNKEGPTFLPIDASEAIAQRVPVYEAIEIASGAFGGSPPKPEESVASIGFSHFIVARKALYGSTVGEFTRLLFSVRHSLAGEVPAVSQIHAPDTDKDATVAVHSGAVAYIGGDQKNLLERYGDWLYWGMLLFSLVGSAIASVMSYFKVDEHIGRQRGLNHLLELVKEARSADSVEKLEQLQTDADDILAKTIDEASKEALEEGMLTAFRLALARVHEAIIDRRAVLTSPQARAG